MFSYIVTSVLLRHSLDLHQQYSICSKKSPCVSPKFYLLEVRVPGICFCSGLQRKKGTRTDFPLKTKTYTKHTFRHRISLPFFLFPLLLKQTLKAASPLPVSQRYMEFLHCYFYLQNRCAERGDSVLRQHKLYQNTATDTFNSVFLVLTLFLGPKGYVANRSISHSFDLLVSKYWPSSLQKQTYCSSVKELARCMSIIQSCDSFMILGFKSTQSWPQTTQNQKELLKHSTLTISV